MADIDDNQPPHVAYVAFCYLLLFVSFLPCQNLVTSLFGASGYDYLAVVYASFCIFNTMAPTVVERLSPPGAMVLGCIGYVSGPVEGISNSSRG